MSKITIVSETDDRATVMALTALTLKAERNGFAVEVENDEELSTRTISHPFCSAAQLFNYMYDKQDEVEVAGRGVAYNRYLALVRDGVNSVRDLIEEGELDDVQDVKSNITENTVCEDDEQALFILTHSSSRMEALAKMNQGNSLLEVAGYALYEDILDDLGCIQDLIDELGDITEYDKEEVTRQMVDAIVNMVQNEGLAETVAEGYMNSEKKCEKLAEYLNDNLASIMRKVVYEV